MNYKKIYDFKKKEDDLLIKKENFDIVIVSNYQKDLDEMRTNDYKKGVSVS